MKDELALKKSSSVAEEVMSAVDQPASSSASLEAACLAAEPEGALPGSRRNTPSPELKESTWSEGTREPVPSSNLMDEGCHSPSLKGGCFGSGDPCVMEVSVYTGSHPFEALAILSQLSPKQALDWNTFVAVCEGQCGPCIEIYTLVCLQQTGTQYAGLIALSHHPCPRYHVPLVELYSCTRSFHLRIGRGTVCIICECKCIVYPSMYVSAMVHRCMCVYMPAYVFLYVYV